MIFGEFPLAEAAGVRLAHTLKVGARTFAKGRCLDAADLAVLRRDGIAAVTGARLAPDDRDEDAAAAAVAGLLASPGLEVRPARAGRCNVHASAVGVATVAPARIDAMNAVTGDVAIATLAPWTPVKRGQVVATVKVIPFAVAGADLERLAAVAAAGPGPGPALGLAPLAARRGALVLSESAATTAKLLDATVAATRRRLEDLGSRLTLELRCPHAPQPIAHALAEALAAGCDLLLVSGATVTKDPRDVVPAAIAALGGKVVHFGMPVEPGNMLLLGRIGRVPVIVLPGCARSRRANGLDRVLHRLLAGLPLGPAEIMGMGVGGLIRNPPAEQEDREEGGAPANPPVAEAPRIGALVLAAGRSTRMGDANKLLATLDGIPFVTRAVNAALAARVAQVLVVTGHEADRIQAALAGRPVSFAYNRDFAEGMATSIRCGLAALRPDLDAVIVLLADMPRITADEVDRLIAAFDPRAPGIVVPVKDGRRGNPVLWPRRFFREIMELTGDAGARSLIERHADRVTAVPFDTDAIFADADTPEALAALGADLACAAPEGGG